MISRLKPFLGKEELLALVSSSANAVVDFERKFAEKFRASDAIAFPYGRSAQWAFLKALGIENAEIVQPAYTCSVVAHATVLSGNRPRFVDCNLRDYNMDLEQFAAAINQHTAAVIPTHLFGYPMDIDEVDRIVRTAEKRFGHKIWVIQDCAHSFEADWKGHSVVTAGDVALFGMNISKTITSIFGGMLTFKDIEMAQKVRIWRDEHFKQSAWFKSILRRLYLLATYPAFNESFYGMVYWLQEATPLLNKLTKAYHLDEKIHFPPDYLEQMLAGEARVGMTQLQKYENIIAARCRNARYYHDHLPQTTGWIMPPMVEGATYSHYVIRVPDRQAVLRTAARNGVELGQLIEYSLPEMKSYQPYKDDQEYPNALVCSQTTINLPIYAEMRVEGLQKVIRSLIISFEEK